MLIVRFRETFRERCPEWVMASITLGWGLNALLNSFRTDVVRHTMDSPFFAPLLAVMDQRGWGLYATGVGAMRLLFLIVNGSRPRGSTVLRTVGAGLSATFWFGLVLGAAALPWASGATYVYGGLLALDTFALWFAAGEIYAAFHRVSPVRGRR